MFEFSESVSEIDTMGFVLLGSGSVFAFLIMAFLHMRVISNSVTKKSCDEDKLEMENVDSSPKSFRDSEAGVTNTTVVGRYILIDFVRGMAICFVTYFHFVWNLRHNGFLPHEPKSHGDLLFVQVCEFWVYFWITCSILSEFISLNVFLGYAFFVLITTVCIMWHYWASQLSGVGMIMFCVGMSSYVLNVPQMRYLKIFSRVKNLFLVALGITVVTFVLMPDEYIYFGAIHCITAVSILHLPFLRHPQFAIYGTIFVFAYKAIVGDFIFEVPVFRDTADHMPWFENLGYLLFGIYCAHSWKIHEAVFFRRFITQSFESYTSKLKDTIFPYLGKHSLFIFITHQIFLYPVVKLIAICLQT